MAGRYLITGTQLGLIKGYVEVGRITEVMHLIDEIVDKQFIGNTNSAIQKDVQRYLIENVGNNPTLHIKKYKNEKEAKKYHEEYYKSHSNIIKNQSANHKKCVQKVWKLYRTGKLSEECTDRIRQELEIYSKRLKIRGKCR